MKVYRVYDDEWEDVLGPKQLIEFCDMQMCVLISNESFELIDESIDFNIKKENRVYAKKLLRELVNNEEALADISEELAIELLKLRAFWVREEEVY